MKKILINKNKEAAQPNFRFTIDLPSDIYEELQEFSRKHRVSMRLVIVQLLSDNLNTKEFNDVMAR